MHSATGHLVNTQNSVGISCVDSIGGPHLASDFKLVIEHVDSDNASGASNSGSLNGGESNSARTKHSNSFSRLNSCSSKNCAHSGHNAAANQ